MQHDLQLAARARAAGQHKNRLRRDRYTKIFSITVAVIALAAIPGRALVHHGLRLN